MTKQILLLLGVAAAILPTLSGAAEPARRPADADLEARIEAAEQRLQQAAEELAELNLKLHGGELDHVVRVVTGGHPPRAMLGMSIGRVKRVSEDGQVESGGDPGGGVQVLGVTPGGPADKAGIVAGDVLVALNGTRLTGQQLSSERKLREVMDTVEIGETVRVTYLRDGAEREVGVTTRAFAPHLFGLGGDKPFIEKLEHAMPEGLGKFMERMPELTGFFHGPAWREIELVTLTPELGKYFGTDTGLLVVRAPTGELPLQAGDVILTIAGATPETVPEAMRLLRFYEPGDKLVLEIMRDKRGRTLEIVVPQRQG